MSVLTCVCVWLNSGKLVYTVRRRIQRGVCIESIQVCVCVVAFFFMMISVSIILQVHKV